MAPKFAAVSPVMAALDEVGGASLVLDADLRVVAATPSAELLLGCTIALGTLAPSLLCGAATERPVAEALAAGKPVVASVPRPMPGGKEILVGIRATPLTSKQGRVGWVLLLRQELGAVEQIDAPMLFESMWTRDPAMKRLFQLIERAAASDASVLVRGETGTGKELVAQALHARSTRKHGPFRAINCAALPTQLLESELFGHERGAFTGAVRDNPGHFRQAEGGTLFLDEVAEMPLELQAKLLRVLETHTVIPVGGRDPVKVDVRIVAATHSSLRAEVQAGRFRSDLMYRLRVVPLYLPPLASRMGDVLLLADKLIVPLNSRSRRQVTRLSASVQAAFERYSWPGNVRELRNALEYAFVIGDGPIIVEADLPPEIYNPTIENAGAALVNRPDHGSAAMVGLANPKHERLARALERAGGSRERAAQSLGVSRTTLWRRMKAAGLE
jgi:transcriptional regulator with PAS, ATPase and Fis domain